MSRRRNPLPTMSDGQVLKVAARLLELQAKEISADAGARVACQLVSEAACRLRRLARRVPLWTERKP